MNTGHNCKRQKGMEMKSSTWCNLKTVHFRNVHGVGGFLVGAQINLQNLGRRGRGHWSFHLPLYHEGGIALLYVRESVFPMLLNFYTDWCYIANNYLCQNFIQQLLIVGPLSNHWNMRHQGALVKKGLLGFIQLGTKCLETLLKEALSINALRAFVYNYLHSAAQLF